MDYFQYMNICAHDRGYVYKKNGIESAILQLQIWYESWLLKITLCETVKMNYIKYLHKFYQLYKYYQN